MIRSMTGYGEAERETPAGRLRAEIKSVNHRFFSLNIRLPGALDRYELQIRDWLRAALQRGHVSFSLRLQTPEAVAGDSPPLRLDEARARQYLRVLRTMKERLDLPGEVDVGLLSRFGDLMVSDDAEVVEIPVEAVREVTEAAAQSAVRMREAEGGALAADLRERVGAIASALERIEKLAPARLVAERDRLRRVIVELAGDLAVDEERLVREIAYLAERWDVSEELVRLRSHLKVFLELLEEDEGEPVGKRLGFLIQEMHRETNTIGSKANDAAIEHEVVGVKNEVERLREQVENVE